MFEAGLDCRERLVRAAWRCPLVLKRSSWCELETQVGEDKREAGWQVGGGGQGAKHRGGEGGVPGPREAKGA